MADDKMRNDNLNKQAGGKGDKDQGAGQQSPGRNPQDDQSTGQRSGGSNINREPMNDEEVGGGQGGQQGSHGKGSMGQKR
jgi:hypothetical protein